MAAVDIFLRRFFTTQERRSSPRTCSAESAHRGTFESAQEAEAWYLWALGVIGAVERTVEGFSAAVLRRYYLGLSNVHVSLIVRTGQGHRAPHVESVREVATQTAPDEAADLQSYVSWPKMAAQLGQDVTTATLRALREVWAASRDAVAEELRRREELSDG